MNLCSLYQETFEDDLRKEIIESGEWVKFKEGETLIDYDAQLKFIPLLQEGVIKVFKENKNGDEILLYFLERGETCSFTLHCGLANKKSEIRAVAENDGTLLKVPIYKLDEWMVKYYSWRQFILSSYQTRVYEMLDVIDNIAFQNLDERLLNYLKDKAMVNSTMNLKLTHQEIANDLNSSRVVISRILKTLENRGMIKLARNQIQLKEL